MKNNFSYVLFANKSMVFALATLIINIQNIDKNFDDILCYHDGFSANTLDYLNKLVDKTTNHKIIFFKYTLQDFCNEFDLDADNLSNSTENFIKKYSHLALVKYKFLEHLKNYRSLLLLDLDTLLQHSPNNLSNIKGFAWSNGTGFKKKFYNCLNDKLPFNENEILCQIPNFSDKTPSPNGGCLFSSDDYDYNSKFFCEYTRRSQFSDPAAPFEQKRFPAF